MMNCQSEAWASSISRAAWASTGRAAGPLDRDRHRVPEGLLQRPDPFPGPDRGLASHMLKSPLAPQEPGGIAIGWRAVLGEMARGGDGPRALPRARAGGRAAEPLGAFEPPVTEELGIERRDDDAPAPLALAGRDAGGSPAKCSACSCTCRAGPRRGRRAPCRRDPRCRQSPPELESPGPAHLVELEVGAVAGPAMEPAPYLHGRARVPHRAAMPSDRQGATS